MISDMEARGVPFDVISDTLNGFDSEINDYHRMYSRPGVRIYNAWFVLFVRREMLRVGRFQFQIKKFEHRVRVFRRDGRVAVMIDGEHMHRLGGVCGSEGQEAEKGRYHAEILRTPTGVTGYLADELGDVREERITLEGWEECLRQGDDVIGVHIPSDGPLDTEKARLSYERAKSIFLSCYPEYDFKAFTCFSWLLEKRIKLILGRDTNITRFADRYTTYPIRSNGDAVYSFLFDQPKRIDPSLLPEKTSLHRAVKAFLVDGGIFYEKSGVILLDDI
jgi:hypothetical protein